MFDHNRMFPVAVVELAYRHTVMPSKRIKISDSRDAYDLLIRTWDSNKIDFVEEFKVLFLNRGSRVLALFDVSTGGVSHTVADPKVIFSAALKIAASSIILSHNHPSGNLKPSTQDERLTDKLRSAGRFLDIDVLDHLIITREGFYSFEQDKAFTI